MEWDFINVKTLFLIAHLFGLALGAGGAFISDILFLKSVKDRKITKTEIGLLSVASYCVTAGLILLIVSGAGMFSLDPERYLDSPKFLVKMTVVGIIILNGIFFHLVHIPRLRKQIARHTALPQEFKYRMLMLGSGVVSVVSWGSAIVLGAFRSVPLDYWTILSAYGAILLVALFLGYLMRNHVMPRLRS